MMKGTTLTFKTFIKDKSSDKRYNLEDQDLYQE